MHGVEYGTVQSIHQPFVECTSFIRPPIDVSLPPPAAMTGQEGGRRKRDGRRRRHGGPPDLHPYRGSPATMTMTMTLPVRAEFRLPGTTGLLLYGLK